MRNIILILCILAASLHLNSCTSDHEAGTVNDIPDTLTLTIDGQVKNFTSVNVVESSVTDTNENQTIPTYNILATNSSDDGEFVAFQLRRNYTGPGGLYEFIYNNGQGSHSFGDNFTFITTQNSPNVLIGEFSGPLYIENSELPSVTITNGSFNITY